MRTLWQDLRYGFRMLWKSPAFMVVAVLALTLGIGANTAIFSVVNSLLLRPLPYDDPGQLVQVWETNVKRGASDIPASFPNFADWRDQNQVFEQAAAYADWNFNLTGVGEPERISSAVVSPTFFTLLGIKPILGRVFLPEEDQPGLDQVVVIGQRLWRRRFSSDPNIIGRVLNLGDKSFTVVGVIPQGAQSPLQSDDTEIWAPVSHGFALKIRAGHYLSVVARLRPGVTIQQAQANMDAIAGNLAARYPDSNTNFGVKLVPLHEQIVGNFRPSLLLLLGAVVLILLISSANVANMLLARATARQKEIAIRTALGAGRWRLVRQLLTESVLLALIGGTLGILIALWGVDLLAAFGPPDLPRIREVSIDNRVLGFTFAVSLLTGLVFGLVPALQASRPNLNESLKESGRGSTGGAGRQRVRSLLVVTEVALSLILLVGAGLLIKSFLRLQSVSPGFDSKNVLTMQLNLSGPNYSNNEGRMITFHDQLLDRLKTLPGVESASTRTFVPLDADSFALLSFLVEGHPANPADRSTAYYNTVSPEYFQTMRIPLVKGRQFGERDVKKSAAVAIVNETLARRYFPNEDPLGKRITLNDRDPKEEDWATIVGVVGDTKPLRLDAEPTAEMYMPFDQRPENFMSLMIRARSDPASLASAIRNEVLALDKDQPVYSIRTMDRMLAESVAGPRFRTLLLALFAAVGLILAAVGIYGVISYAVTQRTHEIGVRMALGAQRGDVIKLVVSQGMILASIGVAIGLLGAFAVTRVMTGLLFGVAATDAPTFMAVSFLLTGVALVACYIPARRATRVDPMVALRYE